jgi:hypothetical protein
MGVEDFRKYVVAEQASMATLAKALNLQPQ